MIEVVQGQIHVNSVNIYKLDSSGYFVEIDCRAKYPCVMGASEGGITEIILTGGPHTLRAEDTEKHTMIRLNLEEEYSIIVERTGRYSILMVILKNDIFNSKVLENWWDNKDEKQV
jgi:hypothetical protein